MAIGEVHNACDRRGARDLRVLLVQCGPCGNASRGFTDGAKCPPLVCCRAGLAGNRRAVDRLFCVSRRQSDRCPQASGRRGVPARGGIDGLALRKKCMTAAPIAPTATNATVANSAVRRPTRRGLVADVSALGLSTTGDATVTPAWVGCSPIDSAPTCSRNALANSPQFSKRSEGLLASAVESTPSRRARSPRRSLSFGIGALRCWLITATGLEC